VIRFRLLDVTCLHIHTRVTTYRPVKLPLYRYSGPMIWYLFYITNSVIHLLPHLFTIPFSVCSPPVCYPITVYLPEHRWCVTVLLRHVLTLLIHFTVDVLRLPLHYLGYLQYYDTDIPTYTYLFMERPTHLFFSVPSGRTVTFPHSLTATFYIVDFYWLRTFPVFMRGDLPRLLPAHLHFATFYPGGPHSYYDH